MKKAIHIAGFIIGVIVLYALAIAALAQNPPARSRNATNKWHRATYKECSDEAHRELAETGKEGITGDAPITFGSADGTVGIEGWSYDPCGYADDSNPPHFKARYTHWTEGGKETEITEREYQKHESEDNWGTQNLPQKVQSAPSDVPAVHDNCDPRILTFCGPVSKVCDDATGKCRDVDLLDVPATPKYEDGDIEYSTCRLVGGKGMMICPNPIQAFVGWTCTDKSRFLLFSEDGKAHCLKLVPHD